jgi:hypothetical protein
VTTGKIIGNKNGQIVFQFTDLEWNIIEKISPLGSSQGIMLGEEIPILYWKEQPYNAEINSFWHLYFHIIIFWFLWSIFSIFGFAFLYTLIQKDRTRKKAQYYNREIESSDIQVVHSPITINGKALLRLQVQWQNPETGKIHIFYSESFEYNPEPYIKNTVRIKMDWNNYKKYWVDISEFPELA